MVDLSKQTTYMILQIDIELFSRGNLKYIQLAESTEVSFLQIM